MGVHTMSSKTQPIPKSWKKGPREDSFAASLQSCSLIHKKIMTDWTTKHVRIFIKRTRRDQMEQCSPGGCDLRFWHGIPNVERGERKQPTNSRTKIGLETWANRVRNKRQQT
jgi:hypothetical protein